MALKSARTIVDANPELRKFVRVVAQKQKGRIFEGVIRAADRFDLTMCNPPFHRSAEEAAGGSRRKLKNLERGSEQRKEIELNFGGQSQELWCEGGELAFVRQMILESVNFAEQVTWFTSLVSKRAHLAEVEKLLREKGARKFVIKEMSQGQKVSRLVAWSFRE